MGATVLFTTLEALSRNYPGRVRLDFDPDAPMPFAAWSLDEFGHELEILGAGWTEQAALLDARAQLEAWQS